MTSLQRLVFTFIIFVFGLSLVVAHKTYRIHRGHTVHSRHFRGSLPSYNIANSNPPDVGVGGNVLPIGIYYIEVDVGTPGSSFKVALDTGSSDLLIPEIGCTGCTANTSFQYDPSQSSTSKKVGCSGPYSCAHCTSGQCGFYNAYETCNLTEPDQTCVVSGVLFTDKVSLGGGSATVAFGGITHQSSNFEQFYVIDGVCGFASPAASSFGGTPLFYALYKAKQFAENEFALCLLPDGGALTLGGTDPNLYTGSFQWTPITGGFGLYGLYIEGVAVNGHNIGVGLSVLNAGGTVLDSGTNFFLLPTQGYDAVAAVFKANCTSSGLVGVCTNLTDDGRTLFEGACYALSPQDLAAFPTIEVSLRGGVSLTMSPSNYLVAGAGSDAGKYCLGLLPTGRDGMAILGDVNIQPYYVAFDIANGRIGWAPVNAPNCMAAATTAASKLAIN